MSSAAPLCPWEPLTPLVSLGTSAKTDVVSRCHGIGILDDDVHGKDGAKAAQQRADDLPHKNGGTVLLEHQAIARSISLQAVADLVVPVECVEAAGHERQQDKCCQTRRGIAVVLAHDIDVASEAIEEVI